MLPDIQPGNTKILYFFNCLLDGMHTKFFSGSFSYFLSNPIEYLRRLSISNPANQLKDLGKKTENIKIPGN